MASANTTREQVMKTKDKLPFLRLLTMVASGIVAAITPVSLLAQDTTEQEQITYDAQENSGVQGLTVYEVKRQNVTNSIEVRRGVGGLTDYYDSTDVEENLFESGEIGARRTLRSWRLN